MHVTVEQLQRILLLSGLDLDQLARLQAHAVVKQYVRGETILYEGDRLPAQLSDRTVSKIHSEGCACRGGGRDGTGITVAIVFVLLPNYWQYRNYL